MPDPFRTLPIDIPGGSVAGEGVEGPTINCDLSLALCGGDC